MDDKTDVTLECLKMAERAFKQRDAYRDALLAIQHIVELALATGQFKGNCAKIAFACNRALRGVVK